MFDNVYWETFFLVFQVLFSNTKEFKLNSIIYKHVQYIKYNGLKYKYIYICNVYIIIYIRHTQTYYTIYSIYYILLFHYIIKFNINVIQVYNCSNSTYIAKLVFFFILNNDKLKLMKILIRFIKRII